MKNLQDFADMLHFDNMWAYLYVPIVMMCVDVLTGWLKAWKTKTIQSSKLREGLVHKMGTFIVVLVALFTYYALHIPLEIVTLIVVYIFIMELISISENLDKIGVKMPKWLLDKLRDAVEEDEDE